MSLLAPREPFRILTPGHTASYTHPISGLMLTEVYGMASIDGDRRIQWAVEAALAYSRKMQLMKKDRAADLGGWRYPIEFRAEPLVDSDLSVTVWYLMFLRSAKNGGFDVSSVIVDEAVDYVRRCHISGDHSKHFGVFAYAAKRPGSLSHRMHAMTGAGVVSLAMAGEHDDPFLQEALGGWSPILIGPPGTTSIRFILNYYCAQAAAQLGGDAWQKSYPPLVSQLLESQLADGSWISRKQELLFGPSYATAMSVLALTPGDQLLPIYQR